MAQVIIVTNSTYEKQSIKLILTSLSLKLYKEQNSSFGVGAWKIRINCDQRVYKYYAFIINSIFTFIYIHISCGVCLMKERKTQTH